MLDLNRVDLEEIASALADQSAWEQQRLIRSLPVLASSAGLGLSQRMA
jgi:hypothetical protein